MSTVRSTLDRPVDTDLDARFADVVVSLDTPLMRSVQRHPAGKARRRPAETTRGRAASYRLTRRGRVVVFLAALVACVGVTLGVGSQVIATSEKGEPVPSRPVTMQPGQTVWDLASEANPGGDIRKTVDEIATLNSLPDAGDIPAGSTVYVPVY